MQLNTKKIKQPNQKTGGPKQIFLQRRHTDGQEAHEKMLNITNYQRNANQNCKEVTPHTSQNDDHGEGVEKMNSPNCQWECRLVQPLWRTVRRFLKKLKKNYHMILQSLSWASIQRKPQFKKIYAPQCSLQLDL